MIGTLLIAKPVIEANYGDLKMEQYIASYKHLIGCEVYCSEKDRFFTFNENMNILSYDRFYLDDENLGTYEEYMQIYYPEYKHIWSKQL